MPRGGPLFPPSAPAPASEKQNGAQQATRFIDFISFFSTPRSLQTTEPVQHTRFTPMELGSSGAGVRAWGGQQLRRDQRPPGLEGGCGSFVRRLPSERGQEGGGHRERRARGQRRGGRGGMVSVWKGWRRWDTVPVYVRVGVGSPYTCFGGRNKTDYCIKGTVQHNL